MGNCACTRSDVRAVVSARVLLFYYSWSGAAVVFPAGEKCFFLIITYFFYKINNFCPNSWPYAY